MSIASDNAYAIYINGAYQANVNGGRTNVDGCDTAQNQFGDPYTGCNWQSVDLHEFSVNGPLVIAVDALDAGGTGGWIGTAVVNDVEYPTNSGWRCWNSPDADGQSGGWSQVNTGWHGDPPPTDWMMPGFVDTEWDEAFTFGANGVGPWGDVNREMGDVDDGGLGVISAASEWIWSQDKDAHNDVFCRLTVPCGGLVLFSEDFEGADAIGRWRGKEGADTPFSGTVEDGGREGSKGLRMNQCTGGGDSYSAGTFICSVASPCLVSFWTKGRPWQGFSEQFAGPHIWTATPQDYHGMHVKTPDTSPEDQDWRFTEYVFPGEGISNECTAANCGVESTFTYGCGGCAIGDNPMRFMLESFPRTGACDSTWFDDITITSLVTPPDDCLAPYSVYKFNLDPADDSTGLRNWGGANSIQLAEITLYDQNGTPLRDGLTCTNPGGRNPGGELPEHACNGLTSEDPNGCSGCANSGHKWLDFNSKRVILSRSAAMSVSPTLNASLLQRATSS